MYNNQIANALFCPIGALISWVFKGFKGSFDEQLNEKNEDRNKWIGILTVSISVIVIGLLKNL
jgi:hypothetical protein